jgi:protein-disulfide isomerase
MQRNTFLFGLLLVAIVGLVTVLLTTRFQTAGSTGETLTVNYIQGGVNKSLELKKVSSDALAGARFTSGSSEAKNTIVEFADYQCPACGAFATQFEAQFKSELIDSGIAQYAFRDFPLPQHLNAPLAAQVAACANDAGRFEAFKAILAKVGKP